MKFPIMGEIANSNMDATNEGVLRSGTVAAADAAGLETRDLLRRSAGNTPENRVKCLRSFWEEVTAQHNFLPSAPVGSLAKWQPRSSALIALMFGQPGFFTPRAPKDWLSPGNLLSYYDTSVLKTTLERLVDFNRINRTDDMRLSVGAVNVRTGRFSYFDSAKMTIRPEHVMASSALPPGLPGIGSPQRAQSTTKYHFSGSTSLRISGWPLNRPHTNSRSRTRRRLAARSGAASARREGDEAAPGYRPRAGDWR